MTKEQMIQAIEQQLNGDQDVLAEGWQQSDFDTIQDLYETLVAAE